MFRHRFVKAAIALAVTMCYGCAEKEFQTCTIPSDVILQDPVLNTSTMEITVSAVYNGDDEGIKDAWFTVHELASPENETRIECLYEDGKASCTLTGLELGKDYGYNFVILTLGDNLIKASEAGKCPYSYPSDFAFSTSNTATAKVLLVTYSGSDLFVSQAKLTVKNSEGIEMDNVPQPFCADGHAKMLFYFDEWAEDVYTCQMEMTLHDGTSIVSPAGNLTLMPLPENLVLSPAVINADNTFSFNAAYDGEDKTVSKAVFTIMDKDGNVIETIEGTCAGRQASASTGPYEYGRYMVSMRLDLVDGTFLEAGPMSLIHAKPREYVAYEMTYEEMKAAGWAVDAAGCADVSVASVKGYNWEYKDLYVRTSGGRDFIYISSSKQGYAACTSPFEHGIKKVYVGFYQSKKEANFVCYAKTEEGAEWELMPGAVKEGNVFTFDLSGGNYKYFKFASLAKQEMRSDYFKVEYYTEPFVEY